MADGDDVPEVLPPELRTSATELMWRCAVCGYMLPRGKGPPDRCPDCDAPRQEFYRVTED